MKYKLIVAYGDDAYYLQEEHAGEVHTAQEWYDMFSSLWGDYNPTEILEFDCPEEMLASILDPGGIIPKCYQYENISDSAWK